MKNILYLFALIFLISCNNNEINESNYEITTIKLQNYEMNKPSKFLSASGKYSTNFWGDKFKIDVEVKNKAYLATFKDIKLKVFYYSKTNTLIGTKQYTVYEKAKPQSISTFKLSIDNYKDVEKIGWEVMSAIGTY